MERWFAEQLAIVAKEEMAFEVDEHGRPRIGDEPMPPAPPPGTNRNSKAYKQYKTALKQRRFRAVMQLRRMAEMAFYKANVLGDLQAIEFIADRLDGKPIGAVPDIAITQNNNELKLEYTFEEARDRLLSMGIDVDRIPLLDDLRVKVKRERLQALPDGEQT
jgi:hypothetical protein